MKISGLTFFSFVLSASVAFAEEIVVKGTERVSPALVSQTFTSKPGKLTAEDINNGVKALFKTGQFTDVSTIRDKTGNLIVSVKEAPLVAHVIFNGNKRLKDDVLREAVKINPGDPWTKSLGDEGLKAIIRAYAARGRDQVRVQIRTFQDGSAVNVGYHINEGEKTKIGNISFSGNNHISEAALKSVIKTKESGVINSLLDKDIYNLEQLEADRHAIERYYQSKGYADVTVSPADVSFAPSMRFVSIGYKIDEGKRYETGNVTVDSTIAGISEADTQFNKSKYFNPGSVEKAQGTLQKAADSKSSGAAAVDARITRQTDGKMDIRFTADKTPPVYIARIEIKGNSETKDYVIRRELDFAEGDALRPSLVREAKRRLEALGYFKTVDIITMPTTDRDRVIMEIRVEEAKTGSFEIGAGYSPSDGPLVTLGVSQKNLLGTGRGLDLQLNRGIRNSDYSLSYSEPYFLGYRMTGFVDLTHQIISSTDYSHPFDETKTGARFGLRAPLSNDLTGSIYYGFYSRMISGVAPIYQGIGTATSPFLIASGRTLTSYMGYGLDYNTLDNLRMPTSGETINFDQRFAGVGGNVAFVKSEGRAQFFETLNDEQTWIGSLKLQAGNVAGLGQKLAYMDHLYNTTELVRGFEGGGIGPRDSATGYSLGGQFYLGASAEASSPLPFIPETAGLRGSVFADAGSVFAPDGATILASGSNVLSRQFALRAAVGVGLSWDSPLGLIKANFAVPVLKRPEDKPQIFSLSAGSKF